MIIRRILKTILLLFATNIALSQANWAPVFKHGYWSVMDTSLNLLYPYKFDELKMLGNNAALAKTGRLFILLGPNSEKVLSADYHEIVPFYEKLFIVRNNQFYGIIDLDGKEIFPCNYLSIKSINSNVVILQNDSGTRYYRFDKNWLSQQFDSILPYEKDFSLLYTNGLFTFYKASEDCQSELFSKPAKSIGPYLCCCKADGTKYLVSFKDRFEYIKTDFFYYANEDSRYTFYRVYQAMQVIDKRDNRQFVINTESIKRISEKRNYNQLGMLFEPQSEDYFLFWKNGLCGIMDTNLHTILKPEFDKIEPDDEFFKIYKGEKLGLASKSGKFLVPPQYDYYQADGDYWIVRIGRQYGLVNSNGKEIIRPSYDGVRLVSSNKFIVFLNEKYGLIDENKKLLLPLKYTNIKESGNRLILDSDGKSGIADEYGNIIVPVKYESIESLNESYFVFTNQQKSGIFDVNGRIVLKPFYKSIKPTDNLNVFYVSNNERSNLTESQLKADYGIEHIYNSLYYRNKIGIVNSYGQVLLEPVYDPNQLNVDFDGNTIIVKELQGVTVINIDNQGRLIDKTRFKNYISIKKEKPIKEKQENTDSLPFFWKDNNLSFNNRLIGLFHRESGLKVIDYYFKNVSVCSFNPDLSITAGPEKKIGLVSRRTGKILLPDIYNSILENDFNRASVARCYKKSGTITLIDKNAYVKESGIRFMDEFKYGFARINKGGKLKKASNDQHQIYTANNDFRNSNSLLNPIKTMSASTGGKWGIMDTSGNYIIKPKYNFLQYYFNGALIAEMAGKWGVISAFDEVLIDFKYDEINHFPDSSSKSWAKTPYFRVKIKNKWGVVDSLGKIIVPPGFDYVEHFYYKGRYYFKTHIDCSKTPYGLVDKSGKMVVSPQYPLIEPFKNGFAKVMFAYRCYKFINQDLHIFPEDCYFEVRDYQDGLAAVKNKYGWGFIDGNGNNVIANQYKVAGDFINGFAKVRIRLPSRFMGIIKGMEGSVIIDKKGSMVYNPKVRNCSDVSNGLVIVEKNRRFALRDLNGKKRIPGTYLQITKFPQNGLYLVKNKKKQFALYQHAGKLIVPFGKYEKYAGFSEGLCFVSGNESGFIDTLGTLSFTVECKETLGFSEGLAAVKIDKKWGFIDTLGQLVIPAQYADAMNFINGSARVRTMNSNFVTIDKNNKVINPSITSSYKDYYKIRSGEFEGIADKDGRILVYPVSKSIEGFSAKYAIINIPRLYGLYSASGEEIAKAVYPIVSLAENGLIRLVQTNELSYLK